MSFPYKLRRDPTKIQTAPQTPTQAYVSWLAIGGRLVARQDQTLTLNTDNRNIGRDASKPPAIH